MKSTPRAMKRQKCKMASKTPRLTYHLREKKSYSRKPRRRRTKVTMAAVPASVPSAGPPVTPPRQRTAVATLPDGSRVTARVDHKESGVPIWMTDRFVPLADPAEQDEQRQITLVPVESVPGAFVLENFFSPAECDDIDHQRTG